MLQVLPPPEHVPPTSPTSTGPHLGWRAAARHLHERGPLLLLSKTAHIRKGNAHALIAKDKHVVVGADFAGHPSRKLSVHPRSEAGPSPDLTPDVDTAPMHSPRRLPRLRRPDRGSASSNVPLAFCGTGMRPHRRPKVPHVRRRVNRARAASPRCRQQCEPARHMGPSTSPPRTAMAMADAFLESSLGPGRGLGRFYEYHRIGYDECENFDYEAY